MRISDWSSDVCSSDLVIKRAIKRSIQQRLGVVDSDQYLSFASTVVVIDEAGSSGNFGVWHHRQQLIRHARVAVPDEIELIDRRVEDQLECSTRVVKRASHTCRSEEHTSELQSLMRISYTVFCLKKKKKPNNK